MNKAKVHFLPSDIIAEVDTGITLSEAAQKAGLNLRFGCFGKQLCGRCRVKIKGSTVPDAGPADKKILSPDEIKHGIRLACRTPVLSDTVVELPAAEKSEGLEMDKPFTIRDWPVEPYLYLLPLEISPPSLSDNIADFDRIIRFLQEKKGINEINVKPEFLNHLSKTLRVSNWKVAAVLIENPEVSGHLSILDVIPLNFPKVPPLFSIALDIGTTTLAAYLLNQSSGELVASYSLPNPQGRFGADVVSRLNFCKNKGEAGIALLQRDISSGIKALIGQLSRTARISYDSIYSIVAVGNSVMQHLLLGLDPRGLAEAPYSMVSTNYPTIDACGLNINEIELCPHRISLINLPGVSGYFGADAVACALVASSIHHSGEDQAALIIDIGTNGEILLITPDGKIRGCSTAAGPAFEGGHISFGTPPMRGAVSNLDFTEDGIEFEIIGGGKIPQGLTGAAIIDLTAGFVEQGLINTNGNFTAKGNFSNRIRRGESGQPEFIVNESEVDDGKLIFTQEDVRQVQLAKGAICGGINTLISHSGIAPELIDKVYLAGAFGSYVRPNSVESIKLIPKLTRAEVESLGNAAGAGAVMAALSRSSFTKFHSLAGSIEYIELANNKYFEKYFIDSMNF